MMIGNFIGLITIIVLVVALSGCVSKTQGSSIEAFCIKNGWNYSQDMNALSNDLSCYKIINNTYYNKAVTIINDNVYWKG